jgi:hypothetical protein
MIIEVYRGLGSRQGSPIIEPLSSDEALIQRGIAEMDANAQAFNRVDMAVVFRPGLRLGQIIEASDPSSATPYRAKITGISISVSEALIETNLTLEQPR